MLLAEERFNLYITTLWLRQGLVFLLVANLWLSGTLVLSSVVWGLAVVQLIVGLAVILYGLGGVKVSVWVGRFRDSRYLFHGFISASGWLMAYCVILAAFSRMDVLMLSRFASKAELANYGVAFQYYSLALLMLGSVNAVLRPKFSRVEMQNTGRQRGFLQKWLRLSVWIGIPVLLLILLGKPVFVFVNGVQYEPAFAVLSILSVGVWLSLMFSPLVNILMARKDFKFLFLLSLLAFLTSLVANSVGVRMWGAIGAAIAVVFVHNVVLQIPIMWRVLK